jgi:hypothetical protein
VLVLFLNNGIILLILKPKHSFKLSQLRKVLNGKDASISQSEAIYLLRKGNYDGNYAEFRTLLNAKVSRLLKSIAFIELGKMNTAESRSILLEYASRTDEKNLLMSILRGLGYCGDKSSIQTILKIRNRTNGLLRRRCEFVADLISYRLNLNATDFLLEKHYTYYHVPKRSKPIYMRTISNKVQNKKMIDSIKDNPYGIIFDNKLVYEFDFGFTKNFVLLDKRFFTIQNLNTMLRHKAILGVVIEKIEERYFIKLLILGNPNKKRNLINILITRPNGDVKFKGLARFRERLIYLSVKSILKPGAFPLIIEGTYNIADSKLKIETAKFLPVIRNKKLTMSTNKVL